MRIPCWHWLVARQVWFTLHLSETEHCAWSTWGRLNIVLLVQAIKQYVLVGSLCSNVQHTCSQRLYSVSRRLIFTIVCARDAVRPKNPMSRQKSNRNLIVGIICKIFDWTGQQMWALQENQLDKICFLSSPAVCKWQDMWGATGHEIMRVSGSQRATCTGLGQAWSLSSKNSQNILS